MYEWQITSVAGKHKAQTSGQRFRQRSRQNVRPRTQKAAGAGLPRRSGEHEGGQIPMFRRMPKRGFSNFDFAERYEVVNVSQLERFEATAAL